MLSSHVLVRPTFDSTSARARSVHTWVLSRTAWRSCNEVVAALYTSDAQRVFLLLSNPRPSQLLETDKGIVTYADEIAFRVTNDSAKYFVMAVQRSWPSELNEVEAKIQARLISLIALLPNTILLDGGTGALFSIETVVFRLLSFFSHPYLHSQT